MEMTTSTTSEDRLQQFCGRYALERPKYIQFALMFAREKASAEDIVDDSFMNLWENRKSLVEVINIESYFYATIKNNCLQWLRNKQKHLEIQKQIHATGYRLLQHDLNSLEAYDVNKIFSSEIREILQRELDKMPELTRLVYIDHRFNDMTYAQIASKYNISTRQVTREIQTVLASLRISLKDYLPAIAALLAALTAGK